jgi:hypothetical protein
MLKTRMAGRDRAAPSAGAREGEGVGKGDTAKGDLDPHRCQETHEKRTIMIDPRGKPTNQRRAARFTLKLARAQSTLSSATRRGADSQLLLRTDQALMV